MEKSRFIGTIFLLVIYLCSATGMRELPRLPLLVEHYYDHKSEDGKIGLLSFLMLHYSLEDGTDKDAEEDSRLPFNSGEIVANAFIYSTPNLSYDLVRPVPELNSCFSIHNDDFISSQFLSAIWQPPRHC